ncbi:PREDICTED: uncharacterized protein LOC100633503 [Amphimedon queenslandica]|uniref:Uncharacterized protein n=1 Tax=Amphimedon queenslandica TaxID=400682 RepID=A0AAN0IB88_AMPQE|nr:PREDICTED: uncharacterized protein LOC100633503 [Amphimedon queenslandica]|eukprot:XP_003384503.1 PREDICTED: uncharacterized protein LOC100633503 [Amphimedon queenslandica]
MEDKNEDKSRLLSGAGQAPAPSYSQPAAPPPPYYQPGPGQQPPPPNVPPSQANTILVHQAQPVVYQRRVLVPPDYTYYAIIGTIFFFPLGLLALYMANKSKDSVAAGNIDSAWGEAITARVLSRISISFGIFVVTLIILAIVLPLSL